jgi:LytS/YehU family sensor histidine kinase
MQQAFPSYIFTVLDELLSGTLQNVSTRVLHPKIHHKRSTMCAADLLILHNNVWPHAVGTVSEILEKYGCKCFPTHHTVLTWVHQTLTCCQN